MPANHLAHGSKYSYTDGETLFLLETAACVHDIGIKPAEEKYGVCDGPLQDAGKRIRRVMFELDREDI